MAKNHNPKNCRQRFTCRNCTANHPTILLGYVPKVKTDNRQSIANPECLSRNEAGEENVTCVSVNSKFDIEVISIYVVPIKISHQNCKKIIRNSVMSW